MGAVYRKELRLYFCGMLGWIVAAILLLFGGLFTAAFHLLGGNTDFSPVLIAMQWVLIVIVPFLTMRSIAQERHTRTDQLLFSLPLSLREIVLGKYFAMLTVFLLPTAVTALYPLILDGMGEFSLAAAYTALLGYILLGAALIAVCTYLSSLVENQITAAIVSMGTLLLLYLLNRASGILPGGALASLIGCTLLLLGVGAWVWRASNKLHLGLITAAISILVMTVVYLVRAALFDGLLQKLLYGVDLFSRYGGFAYGRIDLVGIVFYLSVCLFFLFLTVRSMDKRRLV